MFFLEVDQAFIVNGLPVLISTFLTKTCLNKTCFIRASDVLHNSVYLIDKNTLQI